MKLEKSQLLLILASILLIIIIYFGCDTSTPEVRESEKSLSQTIEVTSIDNIISEAKSSLSKEQLALVDLMTMEVKTSPDSLRNGKLIALSSYWFETGHSAISANYAEQVAESENSEKSWSVAGTTYALCVKSYGDQKIKDYCASRAMKCFENAISINPDNIDHRINMALVNVDNPPNGQPMTGILQLRELNEKFPENVKIMNQLARLALMTGQTDKAIQRLSRAVEIEPENKTSNCLLADAYASKGMTDLEALYKRKCMDN